jgi:hypothetical protein
MTLATATVVRAADLKVGDVFTYGNDDVTVVHVSDLDSRFVEVHVADEFGFQRWLDYGMSEPVQVTAGPSTNLMGAVKVAPTKSATQRAREAVRLGKVRSLPASAALVLYALAAAQDEADDSVFVPSLASVATGAGLAQSTTRTHLVALRAKGLVRETGLGWEITA